MRIECASDSLPLDAHPIRFHLMRIKCERALTHKNVPCMHVHKKYGMDGEQQCTHCSNNSFYMCILHAHHSCSWVPWLYRLRQSCFLRNRKNKKDIFYLHHFFLNSHLLPLLLPSRRRGVKEGVAHQGKKQPKS